MLSIKDQIHLELSKIVPKDVFQEWLVSRNDELGFRTPVEVIDSGDFQSLWALIFKWEKRESHNTC